MATAAGGANFVRFFFYEGNTISAARKRALVALAYSTARDRLLAPKAILIRADLHRTTMQQNKYIQDPKGWHGTFAFKTGNQVEQEFHVASHGYTNGREDFTLTDAVHSEEKSDDTIRGGRDSSKVVWPAEEHLEEYEDSPIAYSHLSEGN